MTGLAGEGRSLKGQWCEGESSSRLAIVPSRLQLPAGGSRVCPACMMKWVHPGSEDVLDQRRKLRHTAWSREDAQLHLGGWWSWDLNPDLWLQGQPVTATQTKNQRASKSREQCRVWKGKIGVTLGRGEASLRKWHFG